MISKRILKLNLLRPFLFLTDLRKGTVIITLHNIPNNYEDWLNNLLTFLIKYYTFIDPEKFKLENELDNKGSNKLLLTFDDGFYSNRIIAERVLSKHKIKAMFFITNGYIGLSQNDAFLFAGKYLYPNRILERRKIAEYKSMNWDDINWLINEGHTIGAHTRNHKILSKLNEKELHEEIVVSADSIEKKIENKIKNFAIPFGGINSINKTGLKMASERFENIFSNIRGDLQSSPGTHFIYRQNISNGDPIWFCRHLIEGRMDWKYKKTREKVNAKFGDLSLNYN